MRKEKRTSSRAHSAAYRGQESQAASGFMLVEETFPEWWLRYLSTTFWSPVHRMSVETPILWHKAKAVNFPLFLWGRGNYDKAAPSQSVVTCLWAGDTLPWWFGRKVWSCYMQAVQWRLMRPSQQYINETFIWSHNFRKFLWLASQRN